MHIYKSLGRRRFLFCTAVGGASVVAPFLNSAVLDGESIAQSWFSGFFRLRLDRPVVLVSNYGGFSVTAGNLIARTLSYTYLRNYLSLKKAPYGFRETETGVAIVDNFNEIPYASRVDLLGKASDKPYIFTCSPREMTEEVCQKLSSLGYQFVFLSLDRVEKQKANFLLSYLSGQWTESLDDQAVVNKLGQRKAELITQSAWFDQYQVKWASLREAYAHHTVVLSQDQAQDLNLMARALGMPKVDLTPGVERRIVKSRLFSEDLSNQILNLIA